MNTLKKDTIFVTVEAQCNFNCGIGEGEVLGFYKSNEQWLCNSRENKTFAINSHDLQYTGWFKILNQYSMSDIIYSLMGKYPDSQTVMWEMLENAVRETFDKAQLFMIDDICNYIVQNLI